MPSESDLAAISQCLNAGPQCQSPESIKAETDAQVIADKELRVGLDAQLQKLKALKKGFCGCWSDERELCRIKITEAIMWLGMDLKRLNDTRPYPSSYDPSNAKVEPTADGLKL